MKNYTVNKAKVTLPLYINMYGAVEVKLFLEYLRATNKLTSVQAKGYKASVNDANYREILDSVEHFDKSNFYHKSRWIFVNFRSYEILSKGHFSFPLSVSELYKKYMMEKFNPYGVCESFHLHNEFFKYTPFLRQFVEDFYEGNLTDGYCCSDCDGDEKQYMLNRLKNYLKHNMDELDKLNLK